MVVAQILAVVIFIAMFLLIVMEKFERQYITLAAGAAVILLVFGLVMRSGTAILETLNLGSFFKMDFWYSMGSRGIRHGDQLGHHCVYPGHDDHGGRNGKRGIFPMALSGVGKAGPLQARPAVSHLYDPFLRVGHVYRQHHRDPVFGGCHGGIGETFEIQSHSR